MDNKGFGKIFVLVAVAVLILFGLLSLQDNKDKVPYGGGEAASAGGVLEFIDADSGVSFTYPDYVVLVDKHNRDSDDVEMVVDITALADIPEEGTLGFDKESVLANKAALAQDKYGNGVDTALPASEQLRNIDGAYAQDLLVLGRFEVCDVTFERKLYFFNDDYQVLITVYGPTKSLIGALPEYFTQDPVNCGQEPVWDFNKQAALYTKLEQGSVPEIARDWYNVMDYIIKNIKLNTKR